MKKNKCVCLKNIKFKNGMNYFKNFNYNYEIEKNCSVSVSYDDGKFTTMNNEVFKNHFELI